MRIRRTVPPAAAPLGWRDIWNGVIGTFGGERAVRRLEAELAAHFGVRYTFLVSSGKAALTLILRGLRSVSPKTEAVIPAYTCFSVPSAVCKAALRLAPCDIDPATLDFNYDRLEEAVSDDTLCVVAQHLFGIPSDLDRLRALCRRRGIFLVEDAAQAMGGAYGESKLGTVGDVGFFSLGRGKPITCGSGGIIVTNSPRIADGIAAHYAALPAPGTLESLTQLVQLALMTVFIRPALYWLPSGLPFLELGQSVFFEDFPVRRLSATKTGVLRRWRSHLARSIAIRAATAADLGERLGLTGIRGSSIAYLRIPLLLGSREHRDRIHAPARSRGLGMALMYPTPITEIPQLRTSFEGRRFPGASAVAERLLSLPNHHLLSERDKRSLCDLLQGAVTQSGPVSAPRLAAPLPVPSGR